MDTLLFCTIFNYQISNVGLDPTNTLSCQRFSINALKVCIKSGVPQGSTLEQLLFLVYIYITYIRLGLYNIVDVVPETNLFMWLWMTPLSSQSKRTLEIEFFMKINNLSQFFSQSFSNWTMMTKQDSWSFKLFKIKTKERATFVSRRQDLHS